MTAEFPSREAFAQFLAAHHADTPDGVWIRFARRGSGIPSVTHDEALEVALCYGWIDAQVGKGDETHYVQRFVPRRARSKWSKVNRAKAEELIAAGAMQPAGLAEVERAKADGRWDAAYEPQSRASIPDDLQAALDAHPKASEFFATLKGQQRYSFLFRLHHVKTQKARDRRIASYIELLREGRTLN